ncbi:hypothetical protein DFJ77DRAFT_130022 [Powellomyces hirtus]|nr:hypothetical protein DFJ77DRAFT_130022 [Powellomyces hirtus]
MNSAHPYRHTPADTQQKISRILGILEERRIYSPEFVKAIKDKLVNRPGTPAANHITGDAAGIARHLDNIKRLDASKAKFSSVLTVEPGAGAEDHSETLANLEQYRQALTADIAERTALIRELKALEERMSLFVKGDQLALEQCNQRIESISPGGLHNNVPQTPSPLSPADSLTLTTPDASATPPLPTDSNSTDNIENSMSPAPPQQDDEEYDPEAAHEAIPSATPPIQTLQPGNTLLPQDLLATLFQQTAGGTGPPIDPDLLRTLNAFLPQQSPSSAVPPQTE